MPAIKSANRVLMVSRARLKWSRRVPAWRGRAEPPGSLTRAPCTACWPTDPQVRWATNTTFQSRFITAVGARKESLLFMYAHVDALGTSDSHEAETAQPLPVLALLPCRPAECGC